MAAFNRGSASDVAALFLPNAELTDDAGNVYRSRKESKRSSRRSSRIPRCPDAAEDQVDPLDRLMDGNPGWRADDCDQGRQVG